MITEYSITVTMLFDNEADRDIWLTKIKNGLINLKATSPAYKSLIGRKGESIIENTTSENW